MLQLNPEAWWEHLTSQLSWPGALLLVTRVCPPVKGLVIVFLVLLKWKVAAILENGCGVALGKIMLYDFREVGDGRLVKWEGRKFGRVIRWQDREDGRVVRWEGERFLVLFKKGGRRVSLIFYLLVSGVNQHFIFLLLMLIKGTKRWSDLNKGMKGMGWRFTSVPSGIEIHSLDCLWVVKSIVGCESVWNS